MSWNEVEMDINNEGGNQESKKIDFIQFPEGATILRIVDNEPVGKWKHWIPQIKRSIICPGKGCPICNIIKNAKANGETPPYSSQKKYHIHVIDRKDGQLKILENSKTFFGDLLTIRKEMMETYGELTNYDIKVIRSGKGKNTKWTILPSIKTPLTEEELKIIEENRIDFNEYFKAFTPEQIIRILNGENIEDVLKDSNEEVENNEDEEDIEIDFTNK
jgi:hypothetical protein